MEVIFDFTLKTLLDQGRVSKSSVEHLKEWLKPEKLPDLTDEQIALFLISCNNEQDHTKKVIKSYYQIRQMAPEIFKSRSISDDRLQRQLRVGVYSIMPRRTADNCAVVVIKLQDTNYRNFDFHSHVKIICMMLDAVAYSSPPDGLINICDLQGTSIMHMTAINLGLAQIFSRYVQECLPIKLKSVHLLNGGYVLSAMFNVFKPFLSREVKELIHFHQFSGGNIASFYETWLGKEFLPQEYGGELPSVLVHHRNTTDKMASMQTYFDAEERQSDVYVTNIK